MALLDLRRGYLEVQVQESLWAYQTVLIKGERYYLTWLDFIKAIVSTVLAQEEWMMEAY